MCFFFNEHKAPGNGRHCGKKVGMVLVALFWQGKARQSKGKRKYGRKLGSVRICIGILWRATNTS